MCKFVFLTLLFSFSISTSAQAANLSSISQTDLQDITKETGAAFKHTTLNSASTLEKDFAFEVGLFAGNADTPRLKSLFNSDNAGNGLQSVPRMGLVGSLNLVKGFAAEVNYLPELSGTFTVSASSLGVKWNASKVIEMPFDFAVRGYVGSSKVKWTQVLDAQLNYSQNFYGLDLQASRQYGLFEPYLNVGYIKNAGELSSNSVSPFDPAYSSANSAKEDVSALSYGIGLSTKTNMMNFAIELQSSFNVLVSSFKFSALF